MLQPSNRKWEGPATSFFGEKTHPDNFLFLRSRSLDDEFWDVLGMSQVPPRHAKWHNSQPWIRGIGCRVPVVTCNVWLPSTPTTRVLKGYHHTISRAPRGFTISIKPEQNQLTRPIEATNQQPRNAEEKWSTFKLK